MQTRAHLLLCRKREEEASGTTGQTRTGGNVTLLLLLLLMIPIKMDITVIVRIWHIVRTANILALCLYGIIQKASPKEK